MIYFFYDVKYLLKFRLNLNLIKTYKQIVSRHIMRKHYQALFFAAVMISSGLSMPTSFGALMQTAVSEDQFQLKVNQTASFESDTIKVKFLNVTSDSRCPTDVTCVWEGEAKIVVNIMKDGQDLGDFNLSSRAVQNNQAFDGHQIQVTQIEPSPTSGKKIALSDYIATFSITKSEVPSPLKQLKSGTMAKDVQCRDGFELVLKAADDSPTCVKPSTASTLISWGWAKSIDTIQTSGGDTTGKIITLADNGKSITLHTGESFLLKLGEMYNWDIQMDNQTVASRAMNIMVVRGAQGVYDAHNPGQAILTGTGDPLCRSSVPACMMPSILFKLNVTVTPPLDNTSSSLTVSTEKDQYAIGESINMTITNNGDTILYPVGWGYSIDGSDGRHYAPTGVLRMMLVALVPGNSVHWTWNQIDGNGTQVQPGSYTITSSYTEEGTSKEMTGSKIIEIIKP